MHTHKCAQQVYDKVIMLWGMGDIFANATNYSKKKWQPCRLPRRLSPLRHRDAAPALRKLDTLTRHRLYVPTFSLSQIYYLLTLTNASKVR